MTTNLSELTNAAGPILSLDLGKYKSVACIYVSADAPSAHRPLQSGDPVSSGLHCQI